MNDALGIDVDGDDECVRRKLEQKDERIERLETQVERLQAQTAVEVGDALETYEDFLKLDVVQAEIDAAKDKGSASPRYVKGVLAGIIAESGPVSYETVAERLGVSTTDNVSKAASELERRKIVTKDSRDDGMYVDLNVDGIEEI